MNTHRKKADSTGEASNNVHKTIERILNIPEWHATCIRCAGGWGATTIEVMHSRSITDQDDLSSIFVNKFLPIIEWSQTLWHTDNQSSSKTIEIVRVRCNSTQFIFHSMCRSLSGLQAMMWYVCWDWRLWILGIQSFIFSHLSSVEFFAF